MAALHFVRGRAPLCSGAAADQLPLPALQVVFVEVAGTLIPTTWHGGLALREGQDMALLRCSCTPCSPPALQAVHAVVADGLILNNWALNHWLGQDVPLVDWFARFAERLQSGYYQADKLTPHSSVPASPDALAFRGISLYPRRPPDYVSCQCCLPALLTLEPAAMAGQAWNPVSIWGKRVTLCGSQDWQQLQSNLVGGRIASLCDCLATKLLCSCA